MTKYKDPVTVTDLSSFAEGVLNTLRYWRDIHTDAESWVKAWLIDAGRTINVDEDLCLENSYFFIPLRDFKLELAKLVIEEDNIPAFYCSSCGSEGEENICEDCGEECYSNDPESFMEMMDFTSIPTRQVEQVLEEYVFPIYTADVGPVFAEVLECVKYYIFKIESANTKFEQVSRLIEALGIAHVHGEIFSDYIHYGIDGMDFDDILNIRENGITAYFTAEQVKEYTGY